MARIYLKDGPPGVAGRSIDVQLVTPPAPFSFTAGTKTIEYVFSGAHSDRGAVYTAANIVDRLATPAPKQRTARKKASEAAPETKAAKRVPAKKTTAKKAPAAEFTS